MKTTLLIFAGLFSSIICFSQNPLVKQWDYRFGGTGDESITALLQTSDGGYILGGSSASGISGDKTESTWGLMDYWIIKIDSAGNYQWDKDFGGTDNDVLVSLNPTSDGGYILGGWSQSGIGGNKTQAAWGYGDYWIVKIDSKGNFQWDKTFGGVDPETLYSVQQTTDGGYVVGGISSSEISGNKTYPSWGSNDFWIVKTDSVGNMEWDKDYGTVNGEWFYSMQQTTDQGYILTGWAGPGISGNKTEYGYGDTDYWVVKIDPQGFVQWDRVYGGTNQERPYTVQQTSDGGYIVGGLSDSGISGNKTQPSWGPADYWIVKIDGLGSMEWDKVFGGTSSDDFENLSQTSDGGYLLTGASYSPLSGDKTENNLGIRQTWVVKINSIGTKEWDKTMFTVKADNCGRAIQTLDGCYLIANTTEAGIGGYKTQPKWGFHDHWIIKFCDTTEIVTDVEEIESTTSISSNPFTTTATITLHVPGKYAFTLYDVYGRAVNISRFESPTFQIERGNLPAGVYFYQVVADGKKMIASGKLVAQ